MATTTTLKTHKGTITIKTRSGDISQDATIVTGTGLAYHPYLTVNDTLSDTHYAITHIPSGYMVGRTVKGVRATRHLVTRLLELADWNKPVSELPMRELRDRIIVLYKELGL